MDSGETHPQHSPPSRGLWSLLSLNWLSLLFQVYERLGQFLWGSQLHTGIYEILKYEATLELLDPKGQTAIFKKQLRVKFLQDYVIAFQDHAWGDGEIMAGYSCSPGVAVDRYRVGDRWDILISLRETKSRGEVQEFHIERKIKRGFTKTEGWWQLEMYHQTDWLKCTVIFPKKRFCRRAVLLEKVRNRSTILDASFLEELPDGRQQLIWENQNPKRFETYTIKWRW